jgi:hypothetical protein
MQLQRTITLALLTVGLSACGGGGGGDVAQTSGAAPNETEPRSLVSETLVIENPVISYNLPCDAPVIQFVIPVQINNDSQDDFIVHYWCDAEEFGVDRDDPTPDALVALVSQPDSTYQPSNLSVFGEDYPKLGGASRKYVRGDLNGDGRDDFAFAMNWEDGRSGQDPTTNATRPSVILSEPDGRYSVYRLGVPEWGHAVEMVSNSLGGKDVVFEGFVPGIGSQAYRYIDGQWIVVRDEYQDNSPNNSWATSFRAVPGASGQESQTIVAAASKSDGSGSGLEAFTRSTGGLWEVTGDWFLDVEFTVNLITWQKTEGTAQVIRLNGQQYFSGAVADMCLMKPLDNAEGNPLLVAKISAAEYTDGNVIYEDVVYEQSVNTSPVNVMAFFELDQGTLTEIPSPIKGEEPNNNFNFFECRDINNDGYADLTVFPFSQPWNDLRTKEAGKPIFYVNDQQGNLVNLDISELPGHSAGEQFSLQSTISDVNQDGHIDVILFGLTAADQGGNIEIQLLRDDLKL